MSRRGVVLLCKADGVVLGVACHIFVLVRYWGHSGVWLGGGNLCVFLGFLGRGGCI